MPHNPGCDCQSCMAMVQATIATNPDGTPFFSEEELYNLAKLARPFEEDQAVCQLAEDLGLGLSRYEAIEITDERAIAEAGLMKQSPDYARIRKAIKDGAEVAGARVRGVEYILRRRA